jgi:hypothetical protein
VFRGAVVLYEKLRNKPTIDGSMRTAALSLARSTSLNQWVLGSSPGAPTTQSSET